MKNVLKKALVPAVISEPMLIVFIGFINNASELADTLIVFGFPILIFIAFFLVFAYIDIKNNFTEK